jgi:hypothetical protein
MRKVVFFCGVLCLLYVGLGLVAGLLPVDVWSYILDHFVKREPGTFYKIVPSEGANYQIVFVSFIGIALIVLSKMKKSRKG